MQKQHNMKKKQYPVAQHFYRCFLTVVSLAICFGALAKEGERPVTVSVKGGVPVNYYQAVMISVALVYGIYLIIRAKRRKRNHNIID